MDVSILVQGPLNDVSLEALEYYRTIGPVVISTWDTEDLSTLSKYDPAGCKVILDRLPTPVYFVDTPNKTFSYQIRSILNGLRAVDTEHVIRTRSDEHWGNLQPLIERYQSHNHEKVVCGNIFFKRWDMQYHFHIGDHLFIGKTDTLKNGYEMLEDMPGEFENIYCAEICAAKAMMTCAGIELNREGFEQMFDVIDINELAPFRAAWQHGNRTYESEFQDTSVIKSMDEL